jgi:hypothetical protein
MNSENRNDQIPMTNFECQATVGHWCLDIGHLYFFSVSPRLPISASSPYAIAYGPP